MSNRPQGSVWAKPCPMPIITPFLWRAAAAVVALLPGCCVALRGVAA